MPVILKLDPILHQPVRTRIIGLFLAHGEVSFTELKTALQITDGNLDAHLRKLSAAGYLHSRFALEVRPRTFYSLFDSGRRAVSQYIVDLKFLSMKETDHDR